MSHNGNKKAFMIDTQRQEADEDDDNNIKHHTVLYYCTVCIPLKI